MPIQKQVAIPTAKKTSSQFPLYGDHVTTGNFMEFNVAKCMELVPNESVKYGMQTFTRLEPLLKPTFGRAEIRNRHFFVPFRTVWHGFNDFITDVPHIFSGGTSALISTVPLISNVALCNLLLLTSTRVTNDVAYDYAYKNSSSQLEYYKFTDIGRYIYKTLRTLGYSPHMDASVNTQSSVLPLLCFMKVFSDWFFPSQYSNSDLSDFFDKYFEDNTVERIDKTNYIDEDDLFPIFYTMHKVTYDADYFTAAWDNANTPNDGLMSRTSIYDINGELEGRRNVVSNKDDTVPHILTSGQLTQVTEFMLTALQSMSDYLKRHQLAGSRVIDRYLARHGIKLSSESLRRSIFLGEQKQHIRFTDVTSTSSTDGATLGDFAGAGTGLVSDFIDFNATEYGMLISISTIVPYTQYYQGINRHTKHIGKLDFWTEEYDALGTQMIYSQEVMAPLSADSSNISNVNMSEYANKGFGFTGRYGEYKVGQSLITGDYILNSRNVGQDAWTLFRDLSSIPLNDLVHGYSFLLGRDSEQYNRIFNYMDSSTDKFNIIHSFEIDVNFPGKRLFDTYEFKDEDKSQKVNMPIGGTTLS